MSASREKKQRQEDLGQRLTQKQLQEQKEAQAQKRKTICYTAVGIIAAVLVAALLIWHSGIFQSRTTAAVVNGHEYTPTDVSYYYYQALNQEYLMAQYGMSTFQAQTDAKEQFTDEAETKSYHDKFMASALDQLTRMTALLDDAQANGFTADEQVQEYVKTELESLDASLPANYSRASYLKAVYGPYMTVGRYKACLEREGLVNAYYANHLDQLTYDDATLQKYYEEHKDDLDTYQYNLCFFSGAAENPTDENGDPLKDEDGNTVTATDEEKQAAMDAAHTSAQEMLEAVKSGGAFDTLAAQAVSENEKNSYNGAQTALGSGLTSLYKDWLTDASREQGDAEIFLSDGNGYYVVLFQGRTLDQETPGAVDVRHILIKAETSNGDESDPSASQTPSQEALDAAKEKAQELLDQWKAGDQTAESFGALAEANSEDPGSKDNGGLYEEVTQGRFFSAFNDWMFDPARQEGDTNLIENPQSGQQGWHVVYLEKKHEIQWKYTAINALHSEDMNSWITGLEESYTAEQGSGAQYVGK